MTADTRIWELEKKETRIRDQIVAKPVKAWYEGK